MSDIESLTYQSVRCNPLFPAFKKAIEEFSDYQFASHPDYIKIRRKDDHDAKYTLQIEETETGLFGRCTCKAFIHKRESVCKHIYIRVFKMLNTHVKDVAVQNWSQGIKNIVKQDIEALLQIPRMDTSQLRVIFDALTAEMPEDTPVVQTVSAPDAMEKAAQEVAKKIKDGTLYEDEPSELIPESTQKAIDWAKQMVPVNKTELPALTDKMFGGTVGDIPKNLVITLGNKPYVTKAGLIFAASRMGLVSIKTKPIEWSWNNKEKRAVFEATVTFQDGKTYSSHGIAIPDGENIKMQQMYAFVDHLAETRAVGRALRNALAFRAPAVEEMPDYREKYQ